mgnify:FL=1
MTVEEPADPVAQAMRLRASDADRERVAAILRDAYAEGRLSLPEHEERLAEAYRATTYADLVPVLRDLPVPPGTIAVPDLPGGGLSPAPAAGSMPVQPGLAGQAESNAVAVFGQFTRRGAWTVPAQMSASAVFGEGILDYTQAVLTQRETVVNAVALFGSLKITVPPGLAVRNEAVAVLGAVEMPVDPGPPGAPVLVIKGAAIFGSIEIKR